VATELPENDLFAGLADRTGLADLTSRDGVALLADLAGDPVD
jgi:hypothetical protein